MSAAKDYLELYFNPEFLARRDHFERHQVLYDGTSPVLKTHEYLWPHELELVPGSEKLRSTRERRSHYTNFIEPLISIYTSLFFKRDFDLSEQVIALLEESKALHDIDGQGTSFQQLIKDGVLVNYLLHGTTILEVSAPPAAPRTQGEKSRIPFRAFMGIIAPQNLVDWSFEAKDPSRIGHLNFARIVYQALEERSSALVAPKLRTYSKIYSIDPSTGLVTVSIYREKEARKAEAKTEASESPFADPRKWEASPVSTSSAALDKIPIAAKLDSTSWIKDVAPQCEKYYNLESGLDNTQLYRMHKNILLSGSAELSKISLAAHVFTPVPENTQVHEISEVDTMPQERRLAVVKNNIHQIGLNIVRQMLGDSKESQSAETMREERENTINLVKSEGENVERVTNDALRLFARHMGKPDFEPNVKLAADVSRVDVERAILLHGAFAKELSKFPDAKKAIVKWALRELDLPETAEILQQVDDYDFAKDIEQENAQNRLFRQAILDAPKKEQEAPDNG